MKHNTFDTRDGSGFTFAIVQARFHSDVTDRLKAGSLRALAESSVADDNIKIYLVPGSYDISYGVQAAVKDAKPNALICLGVIIKGETAHDEYIASATFSELLRLEHEYKLPITLGIITVNNREQAEARAKDDDTNVGYQAAKAAIELLHLRGAQT
jgi:6,7-dimethyl-8-ribityllumazine synthase